MTIYNKQFNFIKGLVYGYAIGALKESSVKERETTFLLSELLDSFKNAKSLILISKSKKPQKSFSADKGRATNKFKYEYSSPSYSLVDSKNEIRTLILEAENKFNKLNLRDTEEDLLYKKFQENLSDKELVIIEIQMGPYLGEDDIIRYEDIYGRA